MWSEKVYKNMGCCTCRVMFRDQVGFCMVTKKVWVLRCEGTCGMLWCSYKEC